jgi:Electron transfer DM13
MTVHPGVWISRRKWILVAVGLPVLAALWWAFRPEKLWINEKVEEAAPFDTSSDPQPILTGRFEGKEHQTSGRATIYKKPGGAAYLRLNDFKTESGPDVHVVLVRNGAPNPAQDVVKAGGDSTDFGPLKNSQGDQNYDLPAATDPNKYGAVLIYSEKLHAVFGSAKLEPF